MHPPPVKHGHTGAFQCRVQWYAIGTCQIAVRINKGPLVEETVASIRSGRMLSDHRSMTVEVSRKRQSANCGEQSAQGASLVCCCYHGHNTGPAHESSDNCGMDMRILVEIWSVSWRKRSRADCVELSYYCKPFLRRGVPCSQLKPFSETSG